jgi:hypothetical protein
VNFSHAAVRRVRAEVLLDVLADVTDTKNKFPGLPLGARAVQMADGRTTNYFLTTFGRATREDVCTCAVRWTRACRRRSTCSMATLPTTASGRES